MIAGRKQTENGKYARKIFPEITPRQAVRRIRLAGGAKKLESLSPEARRLLLGTSR